MSSRPIVTALESWPVAKLAGFIRHELDANKIKSLVASLKAGQELPPIFLLLDSTRATIIDGHHRTAAWEAAGIATAQVIVFRPR